MSADGSALIALSTYSEVGNAHPDNFITTLKASSGEILTKRRVSADFDIEAEYHLGISLPEIEEGQMVWGQEPRGFRFAASRANRKPHKNAGWVVAR